MPLSYDDILARLDELAALKVGDPMPDWLATNQRGQPLGALCGDAATMLRDLHYCVYEERDR